VPNSNLNKLYVDELKDLFNAESQLLKALPKMAKAASSDELRTRRSPCSGCAVPHFHHQRIQIHDGIQLAKIRSHTETSSPTGALSSAQKLVASRRAQTCFDCPSVSPRRRAGADFCRPQASSAQDQRGHSFSSYPCWMRHEKQTVCSKSFVLQARARCASARVAAGKCCSPAPRSYFRWSASRTGLLQSMLQYFWPFSSRRFAPRALH
jgi:hypothetical protein